MNDIEREKVKEQLRNLDYYEWSDEMLEIAAGAVIAWLEESTPLHDKEVIGYEFIQEKDCGEVCHTIYERVVEGNQLCFFLEETETSIEAIFCLHNFGAAIHGLDHFYIDY